MILDRESLKKLFAGFDFDTLESSKDIIYALSKDLNIIYYNPAWSLFAKENEANNDILKKYFINTPITNAIPELFREFYIEKFTESFHTGRIWRFDYECSSVDTFRIFNQITYPTKNGEALIVINRVRVEMPMTSTFREAKKALEKLYLFPSGFINQCSNCRCIQTVHDESVWDWVPEWVKDMHPKTSHTICPICYDYYWKYYKVKFKTKTAKKAIK